MEFFRSYNSFLKELFECKVFKISVDGGFSCPNRDGTKSTSGCIFCDNSGSSSRTDFKHSIERQILNNIKIRKTRYKAKKFIVYFQSFTNTYKDLATISDLFNRAVDAHEDIVGISISTRADSIDIDKIKMIASLKKKVPYVNIEYGLQTIHDKTLSLINRCETHSDFLKALEITRQEGIDPSVHIILGLPGETHSDMMETADFLASIKIHSVKIHLMTALKKTILEKMFLNGSWKTFSFDEYIQILCDFLERLHPNTIILRLCGIGYPLDIVAPTWAYQKNVQALVKTALKKEFLKRHTSQGASRTGTICGCATGTICGCATGSICGYDNNKYLSN